MAAPQCYWLGQVACWVRHNYAEARTVAEEALSLSTELNAQSEMADDLSLLSYIALNQGDFFAARLSIEKGLALFREAREMRRQVARMTRVAHGVDLHLPSSGTGDGYLIARLKKLIIRMGSVQRPKTLSS